MLINGSCGQKKQCIRRDLLFRFGTMGCAKHNVAWQHSQQTRDVDPMLAQRLRRKPSIKPALVQCFEFADSS